MGVGGKFDGGGGSGARILGAQQKDMIPEQSFQLSNSASDNANFKNRKSYINRLGIGKSSGIIDIANAN